MQSCTGTGVLANPGFRLGFLSSTRAAETCIARSYELSGGELVVFPHLQRRSKHEVMVKVGNFTSSARVLLSSSFEGYQL
jgi:hypothetical protein